MLVTRCLRKLLVTSCSTYKPPTSPSHAGYRATIFHTVRYTITIRGTQWIVSVNYLFGRPLISYDFPKGIFTSNFDDVGNLRPNVKSD